MTDDFDEHLRNQLEALGSDTTDARLPGPDGARRRGARRTRNQITGGVLAGVAVITVGIVTVAQPLLPSSSPDRVAQPASQTPTTDSSPPVSDTEAGGDLRAALMTADDVTGDTGLTWEESSEPNPTVECAPDVVGLGAAEHERIDYTAAEDHGAYQDLLRADSADAATQLFGEVRTQIESCLPDNQEDLPWAFDLGEVAEVGDQSWIVQFSADPADQDSPTSTVGLVRSADVVSITVRTVPTSVYTGDLDVQTPAAAATRMCDVLFGADCVGDPEFVDTAEQGSGDDPAADESGAESGDSGQSGESGSGDDGDGAGSEGGSESGGDGGAGDDEPPADPEPTEEPTQPDPVLLDLADNPYLSDDDVNPVGSYDGFTRVEDGADGPPYSSRCLNDLDAAGADAVVKGAWFHDLEGSINEYILRMPGLDPAMRIITDHTILPEQCGEIPDTHEQTVSEPVVIDVAGADDALVWTIDQRPLPDDPGSEPSFTGVGMARRANVVVVVTFGAFADPTDGGWNQYAADTLAQALDRAVQ